MIRLIRLTRLVPIAVALTALVVALPDAESQRLPADYPAVDRDLGSRIRHPHGGRTGGIGALSRDRSYPSFGNRAPLDGIPGYRTNGFGSRYRYRFFDHAVPSFQYFNQQQRNYRYAPETYPGLDDVHPGEILPPYYYYYPPAYYYPRPQWHYRRW